MSAVILQLKALAAAKLLLLTNMIKVS